MVYILSEMMYRLTLRAHFEGEAELERAVHSLERLQIQGATVNVRMGEMGRTGALGLDSLARSALRVGYMFNMLESAWMRQTMAQMMATNAQERYNTVVERYGANSEEARQAAKQLEMQTNYLNMANMRANVSMGLMITQLALQGSLLDKATISSVAHTLATKAATIAHAAETAAIWSKNQALAVYHALSGPKGWAILAGAAAITTGVLASQVFRPSPTQQTQQNLEVNVDVQQEMDFDEMWRKAGRKAQTELRSIRSD